MRFIAFLLLLLLVFGCKTKRLRSKSQFAELYVEALKKANPTVTFVLNPDLSITSKKDSHERKYFVNNAYLAYQEDPNLIEEIINNYVASTSELLLDNKIIAIERIVPVIRSSKYIDGLRLVGHDADSMVFEKYNDQLVIVYAFESENSIRSLLIDDFKSLGISMDSLRKIALVNLDRINSIISRGGDDGLYTVTSDGNYEASLILLSSLWTKDQFPVDGEFIVAIPNMDLLYVTGSNNRAQIRRLERVAADEYRKRAYSVSDSLYKWTGDKFELYK